MPVALLTYHAYGSWLADRRKGYVERGGGGIQPANAALGRQQRASLAQAEMTFDVATQRLAIARFITICHEEGYRPHAAAGDPSHFHLLASWHDAQLSIRKVSARIKNLLSLHLSRQIGPVGRKWFSRGASKQQVRSPRHFEHLVRVYLPRHRGVFWSESEGWRGPIPSGMD